MQGILLHSIHLVLKVSLSSRIWDSSAFLPTSHERAATKAHGPWWRIYKSPAPTPRNHQTSCLQSTKETKPPHQAPRGLQWIRKQPPSRGAGFPAYGSLGPTPPRVRTASWEQGEPLLCPSLKVAPLAAHSGHPGRLPPTFAAATSLRPLGAVDRYFIVCAAGLAAPGAWPCASSATPHRSAPSQVAAFLLLLSFSDRAPAQSLSPAARLPGLLGRQSLQHAGPGLQVSPASTRPRFDP